MRRIFLFFGSSFSLFLPLFFSSLTERATEEVCFCVLKILEYSIYSGERARVLWSLSRGIKALASARRGREEHSATDDDYDEIHSTTLFFMSRAAADCNE